MADEENSKNAEFQFILNSFAHYNKNVVKLINAKPIILTLISLILDKLNTDKKFILHNFGTFYFINDKLKFDIDPKLRQLMIDSVDYQKSFKYFKRL